MKTYLFDSINRYKRYSESLDAITILCNKSWWVFNNTGEKELYIFQENGTLYISISGKVTAGTWKYISANKSIITSIGNQSYMTHPAFIDNAILALQIDGTKEYAFLIEENNKQNFLPQTYTDIQNYFIIKEQKALDGERRKIEEKRREEEAEQQRHIEAQDAENKKKKQKEEVECYHKLLSERAEHIKNQCSHGAYSYFWTICNVISIVLCIVLFFMLFTMEQPKTSMKGAETFLCVILSFAMCYGGVFFFIMQLLDWFFSLLARKWKKEHPNDPVNQYL